ncbi:YidC/Oxa1 family membrane protein insertase [Agromyces archimandritae]|uniref:Membrane protein insertase YidC n=1 Tax=Agromyces archimandritae TaxID=2781962 RepID=A0A975FPA9_9MICO|nr:YidC/Oxa1 family membrane protein insertase [Agromyces archimandritae]QTX05534.1 YidC/Oxa1 family membrane protein insertase [Agromyces archimandritae]
MNIYAFPPIAAVIDGAYRLLMGLADLIHPVAGAAASAAAIVLVTLIVRAALIPVGVSQAKAERMRAKIAPKLAELQRKHKDDPERLQREMMALYSAEGTSPLAGCLPMLVQIPVVGVIYALFILPTIAGHPNELLGHTLGGVPLGDSLAGQLASGTFEPASAIVYGVVILGIAAVGEVTRRVFRPQTPTMPTPAPAATPAPAPGAKGPATPPAGLTTALGVLQFLTAVIAIFVPLAAGIYLFVTVAWTLGQRVVLRRVYPPLVQPATA